MAYAETNESLQRLVGAEGREQVAEALESASFEIDAAFAKAGYTTPLDLASIANATTKLRFTAKLSTTAQALAGGTLGTMPTKNRAVPGKVKKDRDIAREWLMDVAQRAVEFPFLVRAKTAGIKMIGDSTWRSTEEFHDYAHAVFDGRN